MTVKILGVCCSPRKGRTTADALTLCLEAVRETAPGTETELLELAGMDIRGCVACGRCRNSLTCSQDDDFSRLVFPILCRPEIAGVIVGTPVYFGSMTSQCKAFLDRTVAMRRNDFLLRGRVGGVLAVGGVQHGGQQLAIQTVQAALLCHDMVIVSDGRPTAHFGAALWSGGKDGIAGDATGLETARNLGRRVAEIACRLAAGRPALDRTATGTT
jgi:multimeric flavodoxin WrbA